MSADQPFVIISIIIIIIIIIILFSEAVLGMWLPAPLPTPRALPDHGALWPLAVGAE